MVPRKNGACEIIKTFFAFFVFAFITLTRGFVGKPPTNDLFGVTERAGTSFGPAKFSNGIVTLGIIDEVLEIDVHFRPLCLGDNVP